MRIDLHVHTSARSGCGRSTEEEIIRAAVSFGLDAVAFTDHHRLVPPDRLVELNAAFAPFRVFQGIEITVLEDEHLVVLGVPDAELETREWTYSDLHDFVRARDGFLTLAHPFRYHDGINVDLDGRRPDAAEIRSVNIPPDREGRIRDLVARLGCRALYASDAHTAECVGLYHVRVGGAPTNERELVALLRQEAYECEWSAERVAALEHGAG